MKCRLSVLLLFICCRSFSQTQACPVNIDFASGDLTHWYAYTGNNGAGNGPTAIIQKYDSNNSAPSGTRGAKTLPEFNLGSVPGIQVITTRSNDPFGGFPTIPTINGYSYNYSILLGSTSITRGNGMNGTGGGGYVRGVSYSISVPPGPATEPYTMTYAYAMVLENGTHISSQQPVISATLKTPDSVINCASPSYLLPTFNNVTEGGRGATLDSAAAKRNGFSVSNQPTPNASFDPNDGTGGNLRDVWTKGWTEVTFDLSAYRGRKVSLTIEADNCVPGGHFAYAYIAIRNSCAGLMISGDSLVCYNTAVTYSVPALAGATYNWIVPGTWTLLSADTSNIIQVKSTATGGAVSVREQNSCANLTDTIQVKTLPSPVAGNLEGSTAVCAGENSSTLNLFNYSGVIGNWLSSTDSIDWSPIPDITSVYIAENLNTTTLYKVVVGKGTVCPPDTSIAAKIAVDQKTVGGQIDPPEATLCSGQTAGEILNLTGNTGSVQNWQYSADGITWLDLNPVNASLTNTVKGITESTQYRTIDKNGVCPPDTSAPASIAFNPVAFPQASTTPADTTICFGTPASLEASIDIGTSYTWIPAITASGNISSTPFRFVNQVTPAATSEYVLRVLNNGCPNPLLDTFDVEVLAKVVVDAGRDTSVVVGEPLQLQAYSSDAGPDLFSWLPATELSDPSIANPVAIYSFGDNLIKYTVKATNAAGCSGQGSITVKIFKTKPDIFVPNAFTPGLAVNAVFRPIPVGISSLQYFRVYNRLGQLVYNTTAIGNGWDGSLNGVPQASGGYVWMVKGTDYTGSPVIKNGTMVLIR
ncbi:MAG: gliding motility-associated C-terminal domain-containing protein [Bacteroidota bacterium]|nr:gliding motility-associated C-terminal domain-containing protein [Bacteroidota bacterium]